MAEYVRAKVNGPFPVRDSMTRQSVPPGGEVTLLVRQPGTGKVTCAKHPRRGAGDQKAACECGAVLIEPLVACGAISDVKPLEQKKAERA